jgi:hypothetical protein
MPEGQDSRNAPASRQAMEVGGVIRVGNRQEKRIIVQAFQAFQRLALALTTLVK